MVVAHYLSMGRVPTGWVQQMLPCAVVASGVHLGPALATARRSLVMKRARRVPTPLVIHKHLFPTLFQNPGLVPTLVAVLALNSFDPTA